MNGVCDMEGSHGGTRAYDSAGDRLLGPEREAVPQRPDLPQGPHGVGHLAGTHLRNGSRHRVEEAIAAASTAAGTQNGRGVGGLDAQASQP